MDSDQRSALKTETATGRAGVWTPRLRFDRNELSGAFGDIGTDLPLVVGMILASGLDAASVLIMFGAMQVITGLLYGMPMPAQPLKAMAAIVITQRISGNVLYGGGLAIGIVMLLLASSGIVDIVARAVPKVVVRGIQFGLGLQLAAIALQQYVPAEGTRGYLLGVAAFILVLALLGNRRFPPAPFAVLMGIGYAVFFHTDTWSFAEMVGFHIPQLHLPSAADIWAGFLLLALPQIPLSLGNSILATRQIAADLFPARAVSVRKIAFTYAAMNLLNPFLGGVPTCHGSGGIAGHYAFGGRTGGSVVVYGALYLSLGLLFSAGFHQLILFFPQPVLGVILLFEALALLRLSRDMAESGRNFAIVLLVGLTAANLPYGYMIGLGLGWGITRLPKWNFRPSVASHE